MDKPVSCYSVCAWTHPLILVFSQTAQVNFRMSLISQVLSLASHIAGLLACTWVFFAPLLFQEAQETTERQEANPLPIAVVEQKVIAIPPEVHRVIVGWLKDFPDILQRVNLTSSALNSLARSAQFRRIDLLSVDRLVQLASLLSSRYCTIAHDTDHLQLEFERPRAGRRIRHDGFAIRHALEALFQHFRQVRISLSLDLPWAISRLLDWPDVGQYTSVGQLTLHGVYPNLLDIPDVLLCMPTLKVLTITASFAEDPAEHSFAHILVPRNTIVCPKLREITLSPASLPLMRWLCSLESGPEDLRLVRIRVDHVGTHAEHFGGIDRFLQMYGRRLAHLCIWFDETWHLMTFDEGAST